MTKNIFGTDGVRGKSNSGLITPENIMKIAISAVNYYVEKKHQTVNEKFTVIIGKDTRLSGYMLEPALTSGFIAAGANVILLGPIPTPGVAFMTRSLRADLGVVISASHNPYFDNGIKFFNSNGFKISPEDEKEISSIFFNEQKLLSEPENMGKAKRLDDAGGRYIEFAKNSFPKHLNLNDMKIVIDTANGAAYQIASKVFWELGAKVFKIGNTPDGLNINLGCGATDTNLLQQKVLEHKADIGIALDGDADRIIIVDENGEQIDGDFIIAAIATYWKNIKKLTNKFVVATKISNIGLEKYIESLGLKLLRSDIGDKYVLEKMLESGSLIGGEKSGHIIPIEYSSTGDGIVSALQILAYLQSGNIKASSISQLYKPYPQIFMNSSVVLNLKDSKVIDTIKEVENNILKSSGRIFIRNSGTEKITRIMIEADSDSLASTALNFVKESLL